MNRVDRRAIERKTRSLIQRVDTIEGRCGLMRLAEETGVPIIAKCIGADGADVAICAYEDCLRYGTRDDEGFCQFEFYGADGQHVFGWGGGGFDLDAEVFQQNR